MQSFFSLPYLAAWRQAGGVTVADDLATGAVEAYAQLKFGTYRQADLALEALMAGNDLLPLIRPWQWEDLGATVDYLVSRYDADPPVKARIDDAARRVLTLKWRLYGGFDAATITKMPDYQGKVGQPDSLSQVTSIAEDALTLIRPTTIDELQRQMPVPGAADHILFVECWDDADCTTPGAIRAIRRSGRAASSRPGRADVSGPRAGREPEHHQLHPARRSALGQGRRRCQEGGRGRELDRLRLPGAGPQLPVFRRPQDFLRSGPALFDLRTKKVVVFAYNSPYHLDAGELRNVNLFVAAYSKIEPSLGRR